MAIRDLLLEIYFEIMSVYQTDRPLTHAYVEKASVIFRIKFIALKRGIANQWPNLGPFYLA